MSATIEPRLERPNAADPDLERWQYAVFVSKNGCEAVLVPRRLPVMPFFRNELITVFVLPGGFAKQVPRAQIVICQGHNDA